MAAYCNDCIFQYTQHKAKEMASNARKLSRLIRQNIETAETVDTFITSSDLSGGNESFVGDGSGINELNANNISTGTVSDDRLPNTISSDITGNAATSSLASDSGLLDGQGSSFYRNAGNLNTGTISDARLPATISSDITGNAATATNAANADQLDGINSTQFLRSDQNDTFGGDLTVSGNLTVNGTTTSVNSTVTTLDDPVITLANNSTSTDDGKDRGIEFKYGDGSNIKTGFFGWDDTDSRFKLIPEATNNSEVFSGTVGDIQAGTFFGALSGNATTATNADQLDGQQGSFYQNASNLNAGTISDARLPATISSDITGNAATSDNSSLLDGLNSTQFLRSDQSDSLTGNLTVSGSISTTELQSSNIESASDLLFSISNSEKMILNSAGNLGVGKSLPTSKLDVGGIVTANGFIGDGSQLTNLPAGGSEIKGTSTLQKDQLVRFARIEGTGLSSNIKFNIRGSVTRSSNNLVQPVLLTGEVICSSRDNIQLLSQNQNGAPLEVQIISDGDQNFDFYLKYFEEVTTDAFGQTVVLSYNENSIPVDITIQPFGEEQITFNPTAEAYTQGSGFPLRFNKLQTNLFKHALQLQSTKSNETIISDNIRGTIQTSTLESSGSTGISFKIGGTTGGFESSGELVLDSFRGDTGAHLTIGETLANVNRTKVVIRNFGVTDNNNDIGIDFRARNQATQAVAALFKDGQGDISGQIRINNNSTSYITSSDYRIKTDIQPIDNALGRLSELKPSRFAFKKSPDVLVDGFIAHELQTVIPEAVSGEKDGVNKDGTPDIQGVDQSKVVPLLAAALQEAVKKIEQLESRIQVIESGEE